MAFGTFRRCGVFGTRSPFSYSCVAVTELLTGLLPPDFYLYCLTRSIVTGHRDWALPAFHPHLGTAQGARGPVRARERHGRSRAYHRRLRYKLNFWLSSASSLSLSLQLWLDPSNFVSAEFVRNG